MKTQEQQEQKIAELQILEQNTQNILQQKQRFQTEQIEIENALTELKKTKTPPYKVINGVMFQTSLEDLKKELNSKKEVINIRIKNLEKQEEEIKSKAGILQKEVLKELKK